MRNQQNLTIVITPLIVIAVVLSLNIIQRKCNHHYNSIHLVSMLLILMILMMLDEEQENYIFTTNILYTLFIKKKVGARKQTQLYLIILGIALQIKSFTQTYNIEQLILVIISSLIQIGLTFFNREYQKKELTYLSELNSPRGQNIDKIIENFNWLQGSNALLYDSNKLVLHDFQLNQNHMQRLFQTGLFFQCNSQLMDLYELMSYVSSQGKYVTKPFHQFLSKDNRVIVNLVIQVHNDQIFYLVHYQDIPKLDNKLKSLLDISSSISHELSSHLNCIITIAQLSFDNPDLSLIIKENIIEPILTNSQQLELIINNLRDYNNIQSNNFMSQIQQFSIVQEIFHICGLFRKIIDEKQIILELLFSIENYVIESDMQRFRQIFYQLMQNAIKFTNNKIIIALRNEGINLIKIEIIDKGQGMDQQEQKTLKEILSINKLVRVSIKSVGCSLGLFISNLLAQKVGDERKIDFESTPNIGSSFRFWLKNYELQKAYHSNSTIKRISLELYQDAQLDNLIQAQSILDEQHSNSRLSVQRRNHVVMKSEKVGEENLTINFVDEEQKLVSNPPFLKINRKSMNQFVQPLDMSTNCCAKVLIVDDEYFNIFALEAFMKQQKYKTESAYDGQQALNKILSKSQNPCLNCKTNNFQLIFLDINMPHMDGIQTVREIKKMVKHGLIPNVCCAANSAFSDLDTKQRSYDAGMDIYLTKPLSLPILRSLIHKVFLQEFFLTTKNNIINNI
ncbi:hypothetical protein pb186bvf_009730 [Paramecium bursaria]